MTDKVTVTDAAVELVRLAMGTVPPSADEFAFRQAVRARIPMIANLLTHGSPEAVFAQKMIEAKYVVGTLLSVELEESTKRWIVTIRGSKRSDGSDPDEETETFRTDHSESRTGQQMYEKLKKHMGWEGRFAVWLEPATGRKVKVRQLQDFVPYTRPKPEQQSRGRSVADESKRIFEHLQGEHRSTYAVEIQRRLKVTNPLNVGDDKLEQCRQIARAIVDGAEIPYGTEDT